MTPPLAPNTPRNLLVAFRRAGQGAASQQPGGPPADTAITTEIVQGITGAGQYLVRDAIVPTTGPSQLTVGQPVQVAWRGGKPVAILATQARRAQFGAIGSDDDEVIASSALEELLDGWAQADPALQKLWFRNVDQLTALTTVPQPFGGVQWGPQAMDNLFAIEIGFGFGLTGFNVYRLNRSVNQPVAGPARETLLRTVLRADVDATPVGPVFAPRYTGQAVKAAAEFDVTINHPGSTIEPLPELPPTLMGTLTPAPGGPLFSIGPPGTVQAFTVGPPDGSRWVVEIKAGTPSQRNFLTMVVTAVLYHHDNVGRSFVTFTLQVEWLATATFNSWFLDSKGDLCAIYAVRYRGDGWAWVLEDGPRLHQFVCVAQHVAVLNLDTKQIGYSTLLPGATDVPLTYLDFVRNAGALDWSAVPYEHFPKTGVGNGWSRTTFFVPEFSVTLIEPGPDGALPGRFVSLVTRRVIRESALADDFDHIPFLNARATVAISPAQTILIGSEGPAATLVHSWGLISGGVDYDWVIYEDEASAFLVSLISGARTLVAPSGAARDRFDNAGLLLLDGGGLLYSVIEPAGKGGSFAVIGPPATPTLDATQTAFPVINAAHSGALAPLPPALRVFGTYHVVTTARLLSP